MANHSRPIVLEQDERAELERLQRSPSVPAGLARRARVVLLMADNVSGAEIARMSGYSVVQVSRLRRRFAEERLAGLQDKPRSGRPLRINARKRAQVVAMTLKPPPAGITHWSSRDLAGEVGVSHSTVHRIWRAHDLQPHRIETFKFSTDPNAEEKIHDVVGLCLKPPANAVVLSVDEKTAREVASGRVVGKCSERHTGADFLRFLNVLTRSYYKRDLHVILDNSSTHKTPEIQAWLAAHPRVHFHFTPTGASWLNMVEAWFGILTRKSVRRGSFDTVSALITHIGQYIDRWNDNPTPFVWTKEPAAIIKKALRRAH